MGPRLLFGTVSDLRQRCDIASVRLTQSEPGYDPGALIPCDDWEPLTSTEAENLRPTTRPQTRR